MDEQNKAALDKAISMLVDSMEHGKEFVIEQAPLVVQELVRVGVVKHGICAAICVVLAIAFVAIAKRALKWCDREMHLSYSGNEVGGFLFVFAPSAIGAVALLFVAASEAAWFLEAWFAPRVYVLHQIKELI